MVRNVIIDCDTGVDDAMALSLALRSPALQVAGITTVAGNTYLENVVRNTLTVAEQAGSSVPVYGGAARPLAGTLRVAAEVHGEDGLGGITFPLPRRSAEQENAVQYLIRSFLDSDGSLELITLGPLTNVALALALRPDLAERIPAITMMAGGINGGNVTPAAEFNVWVDPEAADVVFRSGIPITMIALDPIYQDGVIRPEDIDRIEAPGYPWCALVSRLLRMHTNRYHDFLGPDHPATPPDLLAVGVAIDPSIVTEAGDFHVAVETGGSHTRGMTVVDRRWFARRESDMPRYNARVVLRVDNQRYQRLVVDTLTAAGQEG